MRSRDIILNQNDNNQIITDSTLLDNININQGGYELNLDKKSLNQFNNNNNKKKPQLNDNDHMSTKSNVSIYFKQKNTTALFLFLCFFFL